MKYVKKVPNETLKLKIIITKNERFIEWAKKKKKKRLSIAEKISKLEVGHSIYKMKQRKNAAKNHKKKKRREPQGLCKII